MAEHGVAGDTAHVPRAVGLTDAEVAQRGAEAKTNDLPSRAPARRSCFDPSNLALTTAAATIGLFGAAAVEMSWWVQGWVIGDRRRLWR